MKEIVAILVAIMTLGTTTPTEVVEVTGAVYSTTKEIEAVTNAWVDLVDTDGNAWRWCFNSADTTEYRQSFLKGNLASCLMDDMGTPDVEDDRFLMVTPTEYESSEK